MGACAALLLLIAVTACFFEFRKISRLKRDIETHSKILTEKERFVENYREKLSFYKTPEGISHLAREQYDLVRPGERVFVIVSASPDAAK